MQLRGHADRLSVIAQNTAAQISAISTPATPSRCGTDMRSSDGAIGRRRMRIARDDGGWCVHAICIGHASRLWRQSRLLQYNIRSARSIAAASTIGLIAKRRSSSPCLAGPTARSRMAGRMSEQKPRVVCVGEVHDRTGARQRRPVRARLRRRHLQHRGLSRARRHRGGLCHRARRRPLFRQHPGACRRRRASRRDLILRVPGRLPGLCLVETDASGERSFRIGATAPRRASCSNCRTGAASPKA